MALREKIFPAPFRGDDINTNFRKILGRSVRNGGLGIPDPQFSAKSAYNTSKAASRELIDSLLGRSALNYVDHRAIVRKASLAARCANIHVKIGDLARRKYLAGGQERNRLRGSTRNGALLSAVPHCLNSTELSRE